MLFEGRIETTHFQEFFCLQVTRGLDTCTRRKCRCTADEHRLLDQPIAFETTGLNNQTNTSVNASSGSGAGLDSAN